MNNMTSNSSSTRRRSTQCFTTSPSRRKDHLLFFYILLVATLIEVTESFYLLPKQFTSTSSSSTTTRSCSSLSSPVQSSSSSTSSSSSSLLASTSLYSVTTKQTPEVIARRKELLQRDGSYFRLDRKDGSIEFGASANLVTQLLSSTGGGGVGVPTSAVLIEEWLLADGGRGLARSIWDEKLITELPHDSGSGSIGRDDDDGTTSATTAGIPASYRMQVMPLQFVTIRLSPSVDVQMWTQPPGKNKAGRMLPPIFKMQSIAFEPNLELLPGMTITAESLGIRIEVVGDLRPTVDGTGVTGKISFATTGVLPTPLRILPEGAIKVASDAINDTIVQFAIQSFQKGARSEFRQFQTQKASKDVATAKATLATTTTTRTTE